MTKTPANNRYQMKELLSAIQKADSILLFSHVSPDGDTIGSVLALKMMLTRLQKRVMMVLDGVVPANLFFLPDIYGFRRPEDLVLQMDTETAQILAIAVDVGAEERMGEGKKLFFSVPMNAQIDHHGTNPGYAQINLIDGDAPAAAILVGRLCQELGLTINKEEAICLYTALSTDTGNFVYRSTNAEAFLLMSKLMEAGLPLAKHSRILFRRKEREFIALLGKALPTMRFVANGGIAGMRLSQKDIQEAGAINDNTDGIVDYAIDMANVKMAYFVRETEDGSIKCSLRALSPCRVDGVAAAFGGGGHMLASGCTLHLPLEEAALRVEEMMTRALEGKLEQ